jgi:hypothetical protein
MLCQPSLLDMLGLIKTTALLSQKYKSTRGLVRYTHHGAAKDPFIQT